MSSRERRLLDKDIEIRKLQGELKHYKTCFFSCVFEKDRTCKALDVAVDALKDNLSQANFTQMLDASRFHCIRTKCELALEQITALTKGGRNE